MSESLNIIVAQRDAVAAQIDALSDWLSANSANDPRWYEKYCERKELRDKLMQLNAQINNYQLINSF